LEDLEAEEAPAAEEDPAPDYPETELK